MSVGMREADKSVVAVFLDVPISAVDEQLDSMSPKLFAYMETLFAKYTRDTLFEESNER